MQLGSAIGYNAELRKLFYSRKNSFVIHWFLQKKKRTGKEIKEEMWKQTMR